ncbi:hemerythrin domain-containing protein [Amycolatopsis benzoatilytica]|uniref:hemerythrin domain-containing protein n=1 Tax=Amycolatopsis benzoatilytica TaxID=346045 RepID=UPI0003667A22|nr:hemerythrin domain-containing protein [Amycolatopsis benzoatilytica]
MCEYCGCQALAAVEELTREHDEAVALISRVRGAHARGDGAEMAVLANRIAQLLRPHTTVEEEGLFPALADEFPDHIADLATQHRHIESVLGEAAHGTPADPEWPARLMAALHLLREHILAEQDGVFPAALSRLEPAQWEAVERVRQRAGTGLSEQVR